MYVVMALLISIVAWWHQAIRQTNSFVIVTKVLRFHFFFLEMQKYFIQENAFKNGVCKKPFQSSLDVFV